MKAKIFLSVVTLSLWAFIFFVLCSCNVANRHKTNEKLDIKSISVTKKDSAGLNKNSNTSSYKKDSTGAVKNTATNVKQASEYQQDELLITFDDGDSTKKSTGKPIGIKKTKDGYEVDPGDQKVKDLKFKSGSGKNQSDSSNTNASTESNTKAAGETKSVALTKSTTGEVDSNAYSDQSKKKGLEKNTSRVPWWVIIAAFAIVIFLGYKQLKG